MLGCSLLGIKYELRVVNNLIGPDAVRDGGKIMFCVYLDFKYVMILSIGAKSPEYLKLNKRGLVPLIIDPNSASLTDATTEGLVVSDSTSILTYLALKYNPAWYLPIIHPSFVFFFSKISLF